MYTIPRNFDISILKDKVLNQIAFGVNFITLFFNEGFIQITGSFSFNYNGRQDNYDEVYPVKNDFGLLQILEKKIINVKLNDKRDKLEINFEDGAILCLVGNEMYESFTINFNKEIIRV